MQLKGHAGVAEEWPIYVRLALYYILGLKFQFRQKSALCCCKSASFSMNNPIIQNIFTFKTTASAEGNLAA
jgi:hypothetical protein